jgi:hypothetical protein
MKTGMDTYFPWLSFLIYSGFFYFSNSEEVPARQKNKNPKRMVRPGGARSHHPFRLECGRPSFRGQWGWRLAAHGNTMARCGGEMDVFVLAKPEFPN